MSNRRRLCRSVQPELFQIEDSYLASAESRMFSHAVFGKMLLFLPCREMYLHAAARITWMRTGPEIDTSLDSGCHISSILLLGLCPTE